MKVPWRAEPQEIGGGGVVALQLSVLEVLINTKTLVLTLPACFAIAGKWSSKNFENRDESSAKCVERAIRHLKFLRRFEKALEISLSPPRRLHIFTKPLEIEA